MKKWISLVVVLAFLTACAVAEAGNKNDLAYKNLDELDSISSVLMTDQVIIDRDSIPEQGITVSEITQRKVTDECVSNTTDTTIVTALETGKVFISKQTTKFQLPAAADGLTYTFVAGGAIEIEIQVNTTPDTIVFAGAGDGDDEYTAISTHSVATTGNSVTLVSDGTNWYVTGYSGTWEDNTPWLPLDRGAQS